MGTAGGFAQEYDGIVATPGIAEKGYIDVRLDVTSPGGHSSVPPSHTVSQLSAACSMLLLNNTFQTIGILSRLLVHYEANPYEPILNRGTPMYWKAQCLAEYAPGLPKKLRKALKKSVHSDKALKEAQKELTKIKSYRALIGTTQAIDLINGGVKTNALPEQAWAVVNHRIATDRFVHFGLCEVFVPLWEERVSGHVLGSWHHIDAISIARTVLRCHPTQLLEIVSQLLTDPF